MNDQTTIGQVGVGPGGAIQGNEDDGFRQEVRQVMENIGQVLQRHGLRYRHLVNVTIFLTDMANYTEMNKVYSEFFQDSFPSRVCIAVKELAMNARIEISAIASLS